MPKLSFSEMIGEICDNDSRYDSEVYGFVREGLDYTLKSLKRHGQGANRHVSGPELLGGLKDYALKEYGPMSKSVLNIWGVKTCEDFGNIVFNLVNSGVLGKTETDSLSDFKEGFSFDEAFVKPFEPRREKTASHKRRPAASKKKSKRPSSKSVTKSL